MKRLLYSIVSENDLQKNTRRLCDDLLALPHPYQQHAGDDDGEEEEELRRRRRTIGLETAGS